MSFEDFEYSAAGAKPVFLYLFTLGAQQFAYCTADTSITHSGVTYEPAQIGDDGVKVTGDAAADSLKITAQADLAVAQLFRGSPPGNEVFLDVRYLDASFITGSILMWSGSLVGVSWPSFDRCEMSCLSLVSSFGSYGLRQTWSRRCTYSVYGEDCTLDPDDWREDATVISKDGLSLTVSGLSAFADGVFTGGFVRWQVSTGFYDRRTIERHIGGVLRILGGTDNIPVGAIGAHPGCPRTIAYCDAFFDNSANYSSPPGMPGVSPFDGVLLF